MKSAPLLFALMAFLVYKFYDKDDNIQAVVEEVEDPSCSFTTYRVGYKSICSLCFIELYRTCYDKESMTVHYTTHNKVGSGASKRPQVKFTTDKIISGADAASFQNKNIFHRLNHLLGENHGYLTSPNEVLIDRGHLVPSGDLFTDPFMRATFKYVNVVPQFSSVNQGNWRIIESWVRDNVPENFQDFSVITGTVGVLELKHINGNSVPIYLLPNNRNPIPKWLFKKVQLSKKECYKIMTYNNIFEAKPEPPCPSIPCPPSLKLAEGPRAGLTFCCLC